MALPVHKRKRKNPQNLAEEKWYMEAEHQQVADKRKVAELMGVVGGGSIGENMGKIDDYHKAMFMLAKDGWRVQGSDFYSAYANVESEGVLNPAEAGPHLIKRVYLVFNTLKAADRELDGVEFILVD